MATTWYYTNENGERVSITGGQLKGLAKAGLITPETIVETENGKTAPAGKIKGLTFIEAVPPDEPATFSFPCPNCNNTLQAKKRSAGKTKQCPTCEKSFTVPTAIVTAPPIEAEIYGLTSPPESSPFTVSLSETVRTPVADLPDMENPFITSLSESANPFTTVPPVEENPFTEPIPEINPAMAQSVSVPDIEHSSGASWQVTIIGAVLLLIVGGIGYKVIDMVDGKTADIKDDPIVSTINSDTDRPSIIIGHL